MCRHVHAPGSWQMLYYGLQQLILSFENLCARNQAEATDLGTSASNHWNTWQAPFCGYLFWDNLMLLPCGQLLSLRMTRMPVVPGNTIRHTYKCNIQVFYAFSTTKLTTRLTHLFPWRKSIPRWLPLTKVIKYLKHKKALLELFLKTVEDKLIPIWFYIHSIILRMANLDGQLHLDAKTPGRILKLAFSISTQGGLFRND